MTKLLIYYGDYIDFRLDSNAQIEEQGCPQGYSWYGDELIPNRPSRYSQEEQLEILNNHSFFTGVCPQCKYEFNRDSQIVHYDCPDCGWMDDSV